MMFRCFSLSLLAGGLCAGAFAAQSAPGGYPGRPIRLIVPFPPGAGVDVVGRVVGQKLTQSLGQQIVIDNRAGAGGTLGASIAARATPDGYTLVMGSVGSLGTSKGLYKNLAYDPVKDFAPITLAARAPSGLLLHPSLQVKTVKELVAHAKANPGKLNYSSAGNGSPSHLAVELFKSMAGVNIVHVPYKGPAEALTALGSGQVQVEIQSLLSAMPHLQAGRMRLIATTGARRSAEMPDIPTISEAALPGFEVYTWFGMLAPAGTPAPVIARLNAEIVRALNQPDVRKYLVNQGAEVVGNTPAEFAAFIKAEAAKWTRVIRESGARID
ncbi:MAG: tripartite tricarboxylate transporter substrate binding protein [Betaproteobacteria bacterium]|nr:tripartite tricarboxylate transporter substrate binding protein [Betaproteobacteria bacterium]